MSEIPVSVIVPVYNVEKYLAACLDSALMQTLSPLEIVCVDDGSTDASPAILAEYARRDARIVALRQPNGGLSAARNAGMAAARGEYLLFLDSDDTLAAPDALDMLFYEARVTYESEELCKTASEPPDFYVRRGEYPAAADGQSLYALMDARGEYRPSACMYLLRREFIRATGLTFPLGICHEDEFFTLAALSLAKRTGCAHICAYDRLWREGSIMTERSIGARVRGNLLAAREMERFARERLAGADAKFLRRYATHARAINLRGLLQYRRLSPEGRKAFWDGLPPQEAAVLRRRLRAAEGPRLARGARLFVKRHAPRELWNKLKKLKSR